MPLNGSGREELVSAFAVLAGAVLVWLTSGLGFFASGRKIFLAIFAMLLDWPKLSEPASAGCSVSFGDDGVGSSTLELPKSATSGVASSAVFC